MIELFPHQTYAVEWMLEREANEDASGGLLCDEMGLGKTISTIGLLMKSQLPNTLILGPLAVIHQWIKAIDLCSSESYSPAIYEYVKRSWKYRSGTKQHGSIYITNYDKLLSEISAFDMDWSRIFCDEAHILRNPASRKYIQLKTLKKKHMWLLTGTPIVNTRRDLGTLVSLFDSSVKSSVTPTLDNAKLWMSNYALCRTTKQLRNSLPDIFPKDPTIVQHYCEFLSEEEEIFYRGIQGKLSEDIQNLMENERQDTLLMLQLLMRLRQISLHPQVYISSRRRSNKKYVREDWLEDSAKTAKIIQILTDDLQTDDSADGADGADSVNVTHGYVIFCHFHEEIALLKKRFETLECVGHIGVYDGSLTHEERIHVLDDTETYARVTSKTEKKHTVLLAQIQTAGTGLNLQYLDRVIFTTPWWTAALMDQAVSRVVRMGQKNKVLIHHLSLTEEDDVSLNIDNYINVRVELKRSLCNMLLDNANHKVK
jgi:SNF2 family DNA or RNA helicase